MVHKLVAGAGLEPATFGLWVLVPLSLNFANSSCFLQGFRVCGSNVPEEQWLTRISITKQRFVVNHLHKAGLIPNRQQVWNQDREIFIIVKRFGYSVCYFYACGFGFGNPHKVHESNYWKQSRVGGNYFQIKTRGKITLKQRGVWNLPALKHS